MVVLAMERAEKDGEWEGGEDWLGWEVALPPKLLGDPTPL